MIQWRISAIIVEATQPLFHLQNFRPVLRGNAIVGFLDMSDCTGDYRINTVKGSTGTLLRPYESALWYTVPTDYQSAEADETVLVTQDALAELKE